MEHKAIQAYSTRITQANRSELVVITFEIILDEMESARAYCDSGELILCAEELKRAQRFLNELMGSLDYQYAVSKNLMSLYIFVNKQLIKAIMEKNTDPLIPAAATMERLLIGFREMSIQDKSGPLMQNTQKIFAGLTYGRTKLNETFLSANEASRGFLA